MNFLIAPSPVNLQTDDIAEELDKFLLAWEVYYDAAELCEKPLNVQIATFKNLIGIEALLVLSKLSDQLSDEEKSSPKLMIDALRKYFIIEYEETGDLVPEFEKKLEITKRRGGSNCTNRSFHELGGDYICPPMIRGIDRIREPRLHKGLGYSLIERQVFGIHGLLPPRIKTQEEQIELGKYCIAKASTDLDKYLFLADLQDRNQKVFYRLLSENIEAMMPIVYTPTVGSACLKFGYVYRRPKGLFITINDRGHVHDVVRNWPESDVRAIVVTDGERILGLGDLGAYGMGIPVGKLALYTALAGIQPHQCLPIMVDVGTNNTNLLEDPLYIGLRQPRVTGPEYDDFIDEFMRALVRRYGQNTLIQFEDFGNHNAFRFLDKYRNTYCTFNDDIQGTAAVAVAGLLAASRITNKKLSENRFLFLGAGEAATGIADLCVKEMVFSENISEEEAYEKIWMFDINGLLAKGRPEGAMEGRLAKYAKDHIPIKNFAEVVAEIKPSVLIGASACGGAFTPEILKNMSLFNERPIIFALSNPTSKAECTAQQAYDNTEGRVIFSSGSPFPPVEYGGRTYKTGQGNNAYIFPGVALGVIASGTHHIPEDMFLIAAQALAKHVSDENLENGSVYPPLSSIRSCSIDIAVGIIKYAYTKGLASTYPEPVDKKKYLESHIYNYYYDCDLPVTWTWPEPFKSQFRLRSYSIAIK